MNEMTVALVVAALVFGVIIGRASKSSADSAAPSAPPDADALERVRPILASGNKIAAIKAYREATGAGLRDAKLAVESLEGPRA